MTERVRLLQKRLNLAAALLLPVGLGSAVVIWLTAAEPVENELVDAYLQSKVYRHELEAYGGKASVVADELVHWFESLWHGRTLAFTVGILTVVASAALALVARYLLHGEEPGASEDAGPQR